MKTRKKKIIDILAGLLFFIAFIELAVYAYFYFTTSNAKRVDTYVTKSAPLQYTELYFENKESLPKKIELFKENVFRFTIRNKEQKPMSYPYKAYIDTHGVKKVIDRGTISLKNNESKTIEEKYRIYIPMDRSQIFVKLVDTYQNINFWIE